MHSLEKSRTVNNDTLLPKDAIHLFWSNKEVDNYNALSLSQISTDAHTSMATDVVESDSLSDAQTSKILSAAKNLPTSKTQGL